MNARYEKVNRRKSPRRSWLYWIFTVVIILLMIILGTLYFWGEQAEEESDVTVPDDVERVERSEFEEKAEPDLRVKRSDLPDVAEEIIAALAEEDMETVAHYVHPEKGITFSPYVNVTDEAVIFSKDDVISMLESEETFIWGDYDGKGTPMELTAAEFFDEILDVEPLLKPDDVLVDEFVDRGNTINNLQEVYPDGTVIEFYHEGSEEYAGIDWSSMNLAFEAGPAGNYYLVALVRDVWTI